jgi:rhodanese-related sulfurtransferase
MTRNEYLNELELLEQAFADETFVFDEVDWWVLIRTQIISRLHLQLTTKKDNSKKERIEDKVKVFNASIKDKVKFLLVKNRYKRSDKEIAVLTNSSNVTTIDSKGKRINQYTDPFLEYFAKLNLTYDLFDLYSNQIKVEHYEFIYLFFRQKVSVKFNNDLLFQEKIRKIDNYFDAKNLFNFSIYNLLKNVIVNNQSTYYTYSLFFKNSKYKTVLYYCYYGNRTMAINRAAKDNGIKTIEYQHSLLSNYHYAYSRWTIRVKKCESFFPSIIWVWDNEFKSLIDSNFSMFKSMEAVTGGNVFNSNYGSNSDNIQDLNIEANMVKVLITLQGMGIPDFIKEFILNDAKIFWLIRFHPRYPMDQSGIKDLLKQKKNNIDIKIANEAPLQALFKFVDYHITSFSGCAIEAEFFNVPNLIFGEDGYNSYKSKIDEGYYVFVDNEEVLNSVFNKGVGLKDRNVKVVEDLTEETIKRIF